MLKKIISFIKKRYKILLIIAVVTGIGLILIQRSKPSEPDQLFENPQYRNITKTLEVSGQIDAKKRARLRFLAGGKIVYLGVQEGDWVNAWQTIATIDQRDLQKRLERSLNTYMQQRWDWEDLQDDIKDEILDTSERRAVDKQQWNLDNTVIDVEIQDIAISQSVMSAPFAGIMVFQPITTSGVQVTSNDYFEVVDPQSLIFRAEINEEDIALVSSNQKTKIVLDAYLTEELNTSINRISYVSTQTASGNIFLVELPLIMEEFKQETNSTQEINRMILDKYRIGMNGDALIELESKENVLTIPLIATRVRDGKNFVDIKNQDGEIEEKLIEIGLETDEFIEVVSGLSDQDLVLIPSTL